MPAVLEARALKYLPFLLINVVCVAAGLFVYDSMRSDTHRDAHADEDGDTVVAGARADGRSLRGAPAAVLGGGARTELARLRTQVDKQADELRMVHERIETWVKAASQRAPTSPLGGIVDGAEDEVAGAFDEATLLSLRTYLDEIRRRDARERQEIRVKQLIQGAGIELNDETRPVVSETVQFQERARKLMQSLVFGRDKEGMAKRQRAFEELREEYAQNVRKLLSASDAKRLLDSRIGRTGGYFRAPRAPR